MRYAKEPREAVKYPAVWVEWIDSYTRYGWQDNEITSTNLTCVTVGFVRAETKDRLILCKGVGLCAGPDKPSLHSVTEIPKVAIKRVVRLEPR